MNRKLNNTLEPTFFYQVLVLKIKSGSIDWI